MSIKSSPDIDTNKPVSRQHEVQYSDYYGYPYYWGGDGLWGDSLYYPVMTTPSGLSPEALTQVRTEVAEVYARAERTLHENDDPHLRSCQAVQDSPPFDSSSELNRQQERGLYRHYDRPNYWEQERMHGESVF